MKVKTFHSDASSMFFDGEWYPVDSWPDDVSGQLEHWMEGRSVRVISQDLRLLSQRVSPTEEVHTQVLGVRYDGG